MAPLIGEHPGESGSAPHLIGLLDRLLPADGVERFAMTMLTGRRVLHSEVLATGNDCFVELRVRSIAERALACGASRLLVAHNHPSGQPEPSRSDVASTRKLAHVAAALDIELIDHLIFAQPQVYSMKSGVMSWI